MSSVIVIGSGLAGLACAFRLKQAGHDVQVLERDGGPGGRMRSEAQGRYCIDRGSLAIDGISLTIAELTPSSAVFWITPHTFTATNLQSAQAGQRVNIEVDVLAKYTEKLLGKS